MPGTVLRLLPELSLCLITAVATHLTMSFGQTFMHYKLGHHQFGGKFFRNHINFHHTYYSKDHLVSPIYLGDEGNNTPFFFIPVFLAGACAYLVLPTELFAVLVVASAASFYAHVFFDKEYHVEGSRLQRFAWFRRQQELHFVHHRHANSNFAVIHFFWDRLLGTYRPPDANRMRPVGSAVPADLYHSTRSLPRGSRGRIQAETRSLAASSRASRATPHPRAASAGGRTRRRWCRRTPFG
jgi:sterol desaturase/sphingolipid hydroxylase (fatty acid hydroxylase superfamily)